MQYTDYFGLLSDYRTVTEFGGKSVINGLLAGLIVTLILLLATVVCYVVSELAEFKKISIKTILNELKGLYLLTLIVFCVITFIVYCNYLRKYLIAGGNQVIDNIESELHYNGVDDINSLDSNIKYLSKQWYKYVSTLESAEYSRVGKVYYINTILNRYYNNIGTDNFDFYDDISYERVYKELKR